MVEPLKPLGGNVTPHNKPETARDFTLSSKLLYGGKGKNNILVNVNYTTNPPRNLNVQPCTMGGWEGLEPPRIEERGQAVHGDDKTKMRKENKRRRRRLKLKQSEESQWTVHQGTKNNTPTPHPCIYGGV
jgi:hypothetical protein